jgi:hypothetical protein
LRSSAMDYGLPGRIAENYVLLPTNVEQTREQMFLEQVQARVPTRSTIRSASAE